MKAAPVVSALLAGSAYAQQAQLFSDLSTLGWTELSPEGSKDPSTGEVIAQADPESLYVSIQTQAEMDDEQAEIVEYRKKYDGINDPNMYPYGPLFQDTRIPNADDAMSDPIPLPSALPLFDGASTDTLRASSNGLISLSAASLPEDTPTAMGVSGFDTSFVAGFWNDIWSKKHGRMYHRIEQVNTTLLAEIRSDIEAGLPQFGANPGEGTIGTLQYAYIHSYWRCTHYGAVKSDDQLQNTFQMVITTDGVHSFFVINFQDVQWSQKNTGFSHAVAGYEIGDWNSGGLPLGSGSDDVLNWETTSTQSAMQGRHIFQLDDNPIARNPDASHPCDDAATNNCDNGSTCEVGVGATYTCDCPTGFMGTFCSDIDYCGDNNGGCLNGGTCSAADGSCSCALGFMGSNCGQENPCDINNGGCLNGASCDPLGGCVCVTGWTGQDCGTQDLCGNNNGGCLNGGTCNAADGSCSCPADYMGSNCGTFDECSVGNGGCQNGATCSSPGTCNCPAEFLGATCSTPNPCVPDPCNGDQCNIQANGGFSCGNNGQHTWDSQWPSNENCGDENPGGCLAGAIGSYMPASPIGNGTCTVTLPEEPAFLHFFDAHIRADSVSIPTQWRICAPNVHFEPGQDESFQYLIQFHQGSEFTIDDISWDCDAADLYEYAVYSFPQNYLEKDGRTNFRHPSSWKGNDFHDTVAVSLGAPVANFTVDEPQIVVSTVDNQNFVLTNIPDTFEEVWFQWDYLPGGFFLSNTVNVQGSN